MHLTGKYIVITGVTSGIGFALVQQLHAQNKVIALGRDPEKLGRLKQQFPHIVCYQANFTDLSSVKVAVQNIMSNFEKLDLLINNAAVQFTPRFTDPDFQPERISEEITTNFTAVCYLTHLLLPALLQGAGGSILNINSGLGLVPKTSSAVYCATKGALNIFSLALRNQLEGSGVTVQQAFMPLVATGMTAGRGTDKISPSQAAQKIIHGLEHKIMDHDIGKVKFLRLLMRAVPSMAQRIMKKA